MINQKFIAERIIDKKSETKSNRTKQKIQYQVLKVKINLGKFLFIQGATNSHELFFFFSWQWRLKFSFVFLKISFLTLEHQILIDMRQSFSKHFLRGQNKTCLWFLTRWKVAVYRRSNYSSSLYVTVFFSFNCIKGKAL